jgi:hypothetical protein
MLEAGAKSEKAKLEGKLPPFSSLFFVVFLCGVVASCCHFFSLCLRRRR